VSLADEYGVVCADGDGEVQAHDGEDHEAREENDGGVLDGALARLVGLTALPGA
jgi:hypothetical protein